MKTCDTTGKLRFPDERSALAELAKITRNAILGIRSRRHLETGVYRHRGKGGCGDWHLSSRPWFGNVVNA